jgi:hypothetical protein
MRLTGSQSLTAFVHWTQLDSELLKFISSSKHGYCDKDTTTAMMCHAVADYASANTDAYWWLKVLRIDADDATQPRLEASALLV